MSGSTTGFLLKWLHITFIVCLLMYFGAVLFVPLLFGLLIAFVMYPLCLWLERHGIWKYLAIFICLTIILSLFFALIYLLSWQLQLFRLEIPEIAQKLKVALLRTQGWLQEDLNVTIKMQEEWIHNLAINSGAKLASTINGIFSATANILFMFFLALIYSVLFLYHRSVFVRVLLLMFGAGNEIKLRSVLRQVVFTYSEFIKGMVLVYLIVGILNSIGLGLLGVEHAILFGMLTAIMTIIPYVGIILSALLPVCIAFVTKDSIWHPIGVIGVFAFVQYLEANVIFPKIVGKQLDLSTWATLVAIVAGGIIWGVAGMILFIPMVAILKIIAQNVPGWEPLYILLNRNEYQASKDK